jgi:tripartite-type tricarboxylate transporter receptor subunit TctC
MSSSARLQNRSLLMRMHRRCFLTLTSGAIAAPALVRRAYADAWPKDKVIRAIVPFSAGSTIDCRVVMDGLGPLLGQTIVVQNRGGAGGTIGTAAVANAEPDGYTLLINASAHSAAPGRIRGCPTIRQKISRASRCSAWCRMC